MDTTITGGSGGSGDYTSHELPADRTFLALARAMLVRALVVALIVAVVRPGASLSWSVRHSLH